MNELNRWGNNLPQSRGYQRQAQQVIEQTRLAGLQINGLAALYGRAMDRTADLDSHRRLIAMGNPELDQVLVRLEIGFVMTVDSTLRQMGDGI